MEETLLKGKMLWAIATGHKPGGPQVVGSCKTQLITLATTAALIPHHTTHSQTCVLARRGEAVRLAEG